MIHYMSTFGVGDAWVGNELRIVMLRGVPVVLHAMRAPTHALFKSPWAAELAGRTRVLYPLPKLRTLVDVLAAPFRFGNFFPALANALIGKRESLRARIAALSHFFVACHWAQQLRRSPEPVSHIHSQWIHSGGTIAYYGAWLLGKSFSFTGHAVDLFRDRAALEDKIRRADFIGCISEFHREFFKSLGARDEQLVIVYCGIDFSLFKPRLTMQGSAGGAFRIRAAGRLVEKKGFTYLIDACRILRDRGVALDCAIAGSGPLQAALQAQIDQAGLADLVRLTGKELAQEQIPEFMDGGDVFCLPCVWASDNDVDGLPQMLMEAMACGLPAISTGLVGIPDLIIHEKTGLLVDPNNSTQLADAIIRLKDDPSLAIRLVAEGQRHLRARFDINTSLEPLIQRFRGRLAMMPAPSSNIDAPDDAVAPSHLQEQVR